MEPGLYLLRLRGGWYGRGVTVVGWLRPIRGDWWHLVGSRNLRYRNGDLTSLGQLAQSGLSKNHILTDPTGGLEIVHVMSSIMRAFPAAAIWEKHCPKPDGWAW